MKQFLIITDLDSTFEEFNYGANEFDGLINYIKKFEKNYLCNIDILFVSGTSVEDLQERLNFFKEKYYPIFQRIDLCVLGRGRKYNRNLQVKGICGTDYATYSKRDGVGEILESYGNSCIGACYIGDDKFDIDAFKTIKSYNNILQYGAYALAPRSRRDFDLIKNHIDIYSEKPRILGCIECLWKMNNLIDKRIKTINQKEI